MRTKKEMIMSKTIIAAIVLAASASGAYAYTPSYLDVTSLSGKAMADHPGVIGRGATANPTAKSSETSLSGQAMRALPGNKGGHTAMPTTKPGDQSLSGKAMKDHPGNS
jgi:hypothetical protein